MSAEYWKQIEKLDRKTVEYISHKVTERESKDFYLYGIDTVDGRARNWAYREVARILSDTIEAIKQIEREKRKK